MLRTLARLCLNAAETIEWIAVTWKVIVWISVTLAAAIGNGQDVIAEPADNPTSAAKVELGKKLFFDPLLSANGKISCATCHEPRRAFTDGRVTAVGINNAVGRRNAPTIINAAYQRLLMHDGRFLMLEGQDTFPIFDGDEMGSNERAMLAYLSGSKEYKALFAVAFNEQPSRQGVSKAIAAFEREILSFDAPIDKYLAGQTWALTKRQKHGLAVFLNCSEATGYSMDEKLSCVSSGKAIGLFEKPKAGSCASCHGGQDFRQDTDGVQRFYNIGSGVQDFDNGRETISDRDEDIDAYKTPTLREIGLTNPYGHRGQWATLKDVLDFKQRGGDNDPRRSKKVYRYTWTADEKADLEHFLLTAFRGDFKERLVELGIKGD